MKTGERGAGNLLELEAQEREEVGDGGEQVCPPCARPGPVFPRAPFTGHLRRTHIFDK